MERRNEFQVLKFTTTCLALVLCLLAGCAEPVQETAAADNARVERAVGDILNAVEREDIAAFKELVSQHYAADAYELVAGLADALRPVNSIAYEYSLQKYQVSDQQVFITVRWQRRWRLESTGLEQLAEGVTTFRFDADNHLLDLTGASPWR